VKTGMEFPLAILAILLVLIVGWSSWQGMQVDIASNQVLLGQAAQPVVAGAEWLVKVVVGAIVGSFVTAIVTALIVWARREWVRSGGGWQSGPNAQWQRKQPTEKQPRAPSEAELMRAMIMAQMRSAGNQPVRMVQEDEHEPILRI